MPCGWAAESTDWYRLRLKGQTVAFLSIRHSIEGGVRLTEVENRPALSRLGETVATAFKSRFVESETTGMPLSFEHTATLSDWDTRTTTGMVASNGHALTLKAQGAPTPVTLPVQHFYYPAAETLQQRFRQAFESPVGHSWTFQTLHLALSSQLTHSRATAGGEALLSGPGHAPVRLREFVMTNPQHPQEKTQEWRDGTGKLYRAQMPAQGLELVYLWPGEVSTALSEEKPLDTMAWSRVPMRLTLQNPNRIDQAQFLIRSRTPDLALSNYFGQDARQKILSIDSEGLMLQVKSQTGASGEAWNLDGSLAARLMPRQRQAYLQDSSYLQIKDPALKTAAQTIVSPGTPQLQAALRLKDWVYEHLQNKNLSQGFASAKEALDTQQGDCTEHAVLVTALARAVGLPARVVVGLAYFPTEGSDPEPGYFVYHMWSEAYISEAGEGFWLPLDATNRETFVDATHLKVADSALNDPNDPVALSQRVMALMGQVEIRILTAHRQEDPVLAQVSQR